MSDSRKVGAVAVVGGTHGNELTGVYTIKHWRKNNLIADFPGYQIELLQANEAAVDANKRYIDHDLNRCFKKVDLDNPDRTSSEQKLAKQINQMLGPKGNARVDFIIDLHTSTANMQTNIVLIKMDEFHLRLAAYMKSMLSDVVLTSESRLMTDHHFLCSIADKGMVIEVGAIPQGALESVVFDKTNRALRTALDFVELYNQKALPAMADQLEIMTYHDKLYFPTDEQGNIQALVHPNLIHKDFSMIQSGQPIFRDFDGNDILYEGADTHIAFVNEAAYYDQKIAMCLCRPQKYSISDLLATPVKDLSG